MLTAQIADYQPPETDQPGDIPGYAQYNQEFIQSHSSDVEQQVVDPDLEYLNSSITEFVGDAAEYSSDFYDSYTTDTSDLLPEGYSSELLSAADADAAQFAGSDVDYQDNLNAVANGQVSGSSSENDSASTVESGSNSSGDGDSESGDTGDESSEGSSGSVFDSGTDPSQYASQILASALNGESSNSSDASSAGDESSEGGSSDGDGSSEGGSSDDGSNQTANSSSGDSSSGSSSSGDSGSSSDGSSSSDSSSSSGSGSSGSSESDSQQSSGQATGSSSGSTSSSTTSSTSSSATSSTTSTTSSTTSSTTTSSTTSSTSSSATSSTSADSTVAAADSDPEKPPFEIPEGLSLTIPEVVGRGSFEELLTFVPGSTSTFTNTVTTVAPTVATPVTDPETGNGTKTLSGESVVETSQTWISPTNWNFFQSTTVSYSDVTSTTDADGVNFGIDRSGSVTTTVDIYSTGEAIYSTTIDNSLTYSTDESTDNSDITTGLIDTSNFDASSTVWSTDTVTYSETPTTLPDGSSAVIKSLSTSVGRGGSVDVSGDSNYFSESGTLVGFGGTISGPPVAFVVSSGGNGSRTTASSNFSISGSTSTTATLSVSVTTSDGEEITEDNISGTAGITVDSSSSAGSGVSFTFEEQTYNGDESLETDTYDYFSVGASSGGGGSSDFRFALTVPLNENSGSLGTATTPGTTPPPDELTYNRKSGGGSGGWVSLATRSREEPAPGEKSSFTGDVAVSGNSGGSTEIDFESDTDGKPTFTISTDSSAGGKHLLGGNSIKTTPLSAGHPQAANVPPGYTASGTVTDYDVFVTKGESNGGFDYTMDLPLGDFGEVIDSGGSSDSSIPTSETNEDVSDVSVTGTWNGDSNSDFVHHDYYEVDWKLTAPDGTTTDHFVRCGKIDHGKMIYEGDAGAGGGDVILKVGLQTIDVGMSEGTLPPLPPVETVDTTASILDNIQLGLDMAGFIPVVGEIADLVNAGIHLGRGNIADAGISIVGILPGGDALKLARMAGAAAPLLAKASGPMIAGTTALVTKAKKLKKTGSSAGGIPSLPGCFVAGTPVITGEVATAKSDKSLAAALTPEVVAPPTASDAENSTTMALVGVGAVLGLVRRNVRVSKERKRRRGQQPVILVTE